MRSATPGRGKRRLIGCIIVVAAIALLYFIYRTPKSQIVWQTDVAAARQRAAQEGKPILLYFTAFWCPYCHQLERVTWPDDRVERAINEQWVAVKVDISMRDQPHELADRYRVAGPPTMVLLNAEGAYLTSIVGFVEPDRLVNALESAGKLPPSQPRELPRIPAGPIGTP